MLISESTEKGGNLPWKKTGGKKAWYIRSTREVLRTATETELVIFPGS